MGSSNYSTRKAAFKQIDSAINNLEWYMAHLLTVRNEYKSAHPDISETCNNLMLAGLKLQELTQKLRKSF